MKKIMAFILVPFLLFGYQSFTGTKGFGGIYSALCEEPGTIGLNIRVYGYYESIYHSQEQTTYNVLSTFPFLSLSLSLWKYLEISGFGTGYFYYETGGNNTYGVQDYGVNVKGVIPFSMGENAFLGTGILGFATMSLASPISPSTDDNMARILGYYPFSRKNPEFGALFLLGYEARVFSIQLNAGYKYAENVDVRDTSYTVPQWIVGGLGLEWTGLRYLHIFTSFGVLYPFTQAAPSTPLVFTYPLKTVMDIRDALYDIQAGLRFPLASWFDFELSGGFNPLNMKESYYGELGLSLHFNPFKRPPLALEGVVYDAETKEPISDAVIVLQRGAEKDTFYTDEKGEFYVETKGVDVVTVEKEGYQTEVIGKEELRRYLEVYLEKGGAKVQGIVYDAKTGIPLSAGIKFINTKENVIPHYTTSDGVTGVYSITIPPGMYLVEAFKEGYYPERKTVVLEDGDIKMIDFPMTKKPKKVVKVKKAPPSITRVYFGKGATYPAPEYIHTLEKIAERIKSSPDATVVIEGHTDSVGNAESNYQLGYVRAMNVANILSGFGVPMERMRVKSAGEMKPIGDNRTRSGRSLNRRVEIKIVY